MPAGRFSFCSVDEHFGDNDRRVPGGAAQPACGRAGGKGGQEAFQKSLPLLLGLSAAFSPAIGYGGGVVAVFPLLPPGRPALYLVCAAAAAVVRGGGIFFPSVSAKGKPEQQSGAFTSGRRDVFCLFAGTLCNDMDGARQRLGPAQYPFYHYMGVVCCRSGPFRRENNTL